MANETLSPNTEVLNLTPTLESAFEFTDEVTRKFFLKILSERALLNLSYEKKSVEMWERDLEIVFLYVVWGVTSDQISQKFQHEFTAQSLKNFIRRIIGEIYRYVPKHIRNEFPLQNIKAHKPAFEKRDAEVTQRILELQQMGLSTTEILEKLSLSSLEYRKLKHRLKKSGSEIVLPQHLKRSPEYNPQLAERVRNTPAKDRAAFKELFLEMNSRFLQDFSTGKNAVVLALKHVYRYEGAPYFSHKYSRVLAEVLSSEPWNIPIKIHTEKVDQGERTITYYYIPTQYVEEARRILREEKIPELEAIKKRRE